MTAAWIVGLVASIDPERVRRDRHAREEPWILKTGAQLELARHAARIAEIDLNFERDPVDFRVFVGQDIHNPEILVELDYLNGETVQVVSGVSCSALRAMSPR